MVIDLSFKTELPSAKMSYDGYNVLAIKVNENTDIYGTVDTT